MNRKYIVAGNHMEFIDYCSRKQREGIDIREMYYVTGVNDLRGLSECHGFFIGTYNNRSDIDQIMEQIHIVNSKPISWSRAYTNVWIDELTNVTAVSPNEFIKTNTHD